MNKNDWEQERKEFAACESEAYLMTAAVGLMANNVLEANVNFLKSLNETGEVNPERLLELLDSTRSAAAKYFGLDSSDPIALVPNASHGMNLIASAFKNKFGLGEILMPLDEFPTSTVPWYHHGFKIRKVPTHDLARHISGDTKAVLASAIQFATGYREDLVELGRLLFDKKIPFIVNATQALGAFATPVKEAKITALIASGHKWFNAGYGVGILYLDKSLYEGIDPFLAGWTSVEDPWSLENDEPSLCSLAKVHELGTLPFSVISGVKKSFENIERIGLNEISKRNCELANYLEEGLLSKNIEIISLRDNKSDLAQSRNSGTISVKVNDPENTILRLAQEKIYVTARRGLLRIATHYYNNFDDIDRLMRNL